MTCSLTTNQLLHGKDEPPEELIQLSAGPLTMIYQPKYAFLRRISYNGREIVRGIYMAVRDENWGTIQPVVSEPEIDRDDSSFTLSFSVECAEGDIDFPWTGKITGLADGSVRFEFTGRARSSFRTNRTGFCLLHPADLAGTELTVTHVDMSETAGKLPQYISPKQPFKQIVGIGHGIPGGGRVHIGFEGTPFEMEDQRNWTDASFKTYCHPLDVERPIELAEGDEIFQAVNIRIEPGSQSPAVVPPVRPDVVQVEVANSPEHRLCELGLQYAPDAGPLGDTEVDRLRGLGLSHLRAEIPLGHPGCGDLLHQAAGQAKAIRARLAPALIVDDHAESQLKAIRRELEGLNAPLARVSIFHEQEGATGDRWVMLARRILGETLGDIDIGAGSRIYFTNVNSARPHADSLDYLEWALTPQVHVADDLSMFETLPMQGLTVRSAKRFAEVPASVGPITLRKREEDADPRQVSLLAAAWTLGSIKHLSEAGAATATYYHTIGPRGVMAQPATDDLPKPFADVGGCVYPVYHVLALLGRFGRAMVHRVRSSSPLTVEGLALSNYGRTRLLLANYTADSVRVEIGSFSGKVGVMTLDGTNVREAMENPDDLLLHAQRREIQGKLAIDLNGYGIACVDHGEG